MFSSETSVLFIESRDRIIQPHVFARTVHVGFLLHVTCEEILSENVNRGTSGTFKGQPCSVTRLVKVVKYWTNKASFCFYCYCCFCCCIVRHMYAWSEEKTFLNKSGLYGTKTFISLKFYVSVTSLQIAREEVEKRLIFLPAK